MNAPEFILLLTLLRIVVPFGLILMVGEAIQRHNLKQQPGL